MRGRAVLDNTAALMCLFDAEGRILLFHRACEQLSGWRPEEVVGLPLWAPVIVPEERDIARREIPLMIASGRCALVEARGRTAPVAGT